MPGRHARPTPAARPPRSARPRARHRRPTRPARRIVAVSAIAAASVGVASAMLTQWSDAPTFAGVLSPANSGSDADAATTVGSVAVTKQVASRPTADTPGQPTVTISASGPTARPTPAPGSGSAVPPATQTVVPDIAVTDAAGPEAARAPVVSSDTAVPPPPAAAESSVTSPVVPTPAPVDSVSPASAQVPSSAHPLAGAPTARDLPGRTVLAVGGPAAVSVAKAWPTADSVTVVSPTPGTPLPTRILEALDQETAAPAAGTSDQGAPDTPVEDGSVIVVAVLSASDADSSPVEFVQSYRTLVTRHPGACLVWVDPTNGSAAVPSGMPQAVAVTAALHADPVVVWGSSSRENPDGLALARQDIARDARRTAVRAEKTASASCAPTSIAARPVQALPMARDIDVRVYNATWRNRLARNTSWLLSERNMNIIAVANDPRGAYIPGVADIRYGGAGKQEAVALALHVPGARLVRDERSDSTVDLVLGQGFTGLAPVDLVRDVRSAVRVTR